MNEERRHIRRVPLLVDVLCQGATGNYEARTSDLSVGGCFIDTISQVNVGETIKFKIRLPAGDWLDVQGTVVYEYPGVGFGVSFTQLLDSDRRQLEWLVDAEAHRADKRE